MVSILITDGLIFMVHPLMTESVTYIVQRLASLSTLLYLLSLCLYINGRLVQDKGSNRNIAWGFYTGSAATAAIGMFTKETVFTLPLTIALYEFLFFNLKNMIKLIQKLIFIWEKSMLRTRMKSEQIFVKEIFGKIMEKDDQLLREKMAELQKIRDPKPEIKQNIADLNTEITEIMGYRNIVNIGTAKIKELDAIVSILKKDLFK